MEQNTVEAIKKAIEDKLYMSNYLRKNATDAESKKYHEGWCDLAYEVLGLLPAGQETAETRSAAVAEPEAANLEDFPIAKNLEELSEEKQKEFIDIVYDYSMSQQLMNLFIEVNQLDSEEAWDKANEQYSEDMSYAPNED